MSLFGNDDQYTDEQRKALAKSAEIKAARGDGAGATGVAPAGGIGKSREELSKISTANRNKGGRLSVSSGAGGGSMTGAGVTTSINYGKDGGSGSMSAFGVTTGASWGSGGGSGGGSTAGSSARERLGDPMSDVGKKARDGLSGGSSITETKNGVTTSSGSSHTELGGGRSSATEYSSHSSDDGVNSSSGYSSTTATGGSGSFGTGATENVMKKKKFGIT